VRETERVRERDRDRERGLGYLTEPQEAVAMQGTVVDAMVEVVVPHVIGDLVRPGDLIALRLFSEIGFATIYEDLTSGGNIDTSMVYAREERG
jgi:hypothetical protein